jgi:APA family basic amino acid/polyamine antiporter
MALYLALNLAYALALPAGEVRRVVAEAARARGVAEIEAVDAVAPIAQVAAGHLYGPRVAAPLSVAIGVTLLASVSAYVLVGPRVAWAMARAGQFPSVAGRTSPRWGTPVVATAMQVGWALVLLWAAPLERILTYAGLGLAIFSMLAVAAVYVLRWKRPDLPRPFRTPGYPVVPAIYLAATGLLVAAVVKDRPGVSAYSVGSILAGVPVYYLTRAGRAKPARPDWAEEA